MIGVLFVILMIQKYSMRKVQIWLRFGNSLPIFTICKMFAVNRVYYELYTIFNLCCTTNLQLYVLMVFYFKMALIFFLTPLKYALTATHLVRIHSPIHIGFKKN
jgi:hypothetical protein